MRELKKTGNTVNKFIAALVRRQQHLQKRVASSAKTTSLTYDEAEISALAWAINTLASCGYGHV
jgi:ribose 5-phosphate isomerase